MLKRYCGLFFLFVTVHAFALESSASSFSGQWSIDKDNSEDISAAVEVCISDVSYFIRTIARHRLNKTNTLHQQLSIALDTDVASILYGASGTRLVVAPIDGTIVDWQRDDGEQFKVSHQLVEGRLVEIFRGKDGQKSIAFSLSEEGAVLNMAVSVTSSRLPKPLVYQLVYIRTPKNRS